MRMHLLFGAATAALLGCDRFDRARPDGAAADSSASTAESTLPPGHVPIQPGGSTLSSAAQALLDSGNTAFRLKQFDQALAFYAKASEAQPAHAAPWFGTYMVGQAIDNKALADSALRMVQQRSPGMQAHPSGTPGAAPSPIPGAPHGSIPPAPHGAIPPAPRKS
jgi:hypothetical protein